MLQWILSVRRTCSSFSVAPDCVFPVMGFSGDVRSFAFRWIFRRTTFASPYREGLVSPVVGWLEIREDYMSFGCCCWCLVLLGQIHEGRGFARVFARQRRALRAVTKVVTCHCNKRDIPQIAVDLSVARRGRRARLETVQVSAPTLGFQRVSTWTPQRMPCSTMPLQHAG